MTGKTEKKGRRRKKKEKKWHQNNIPEVNGEVKAGVIQFMNNKIRNRNDKYVMHKDEVRGNAVINVVCQVAGGGGTIQK